MKKFFTVLVGLLIVGFISGCGDDSGDTAIVTAGDSSSAIQTGVFTTTFAGASKTWYTEKETVNNITINQAYYSRNANSITITIGARSGVGLTNTDGSFSFGISFASGVTTGNIVASSVLFKADDGASIYAYYPYYNTSFGASDIILNITQATDDGTVVHIKGSFSGTVYKDATTTEILSTDFEFDANSL